MQKVTRSEAQKHNLKMRAYYLDKFNHKCMKCSSSDKLELDHIKSISEGGDNSEENIQVLCSLCNKKKGGKRYRGGYTGTTKPCIPYQIRIDQELFDKVKKSAKEDERSVNAQIRFLLKCALAKK